MKFICVLFCLLFALQSALTGASQTKPDKEKDEIIRVDTQLVDVPVSVAGSDGRPIRDLKKTNFQVFEDGKPQTIESFATASAPFEVVLILDTSGSARSDLQLIKRAAADFIQSLRPGDRVAVTAFNSEKIDGQSFAFNEVLSPLTNDRDRLRSAIDRASVSNGTPYYDSLIDVAEKIFRDAASDEFRGRRAVVALTDGVDSTSSADFEEVREKLAQIGVICYFIKVDTREFFESGILGDCQSATRFSVAQIRRYYRGMSSSSRTGMTTDFCQLGDFERLAISKRLYEIADEEMSEIAKSSGGAIFPVGDLTEARGAFRSVANAIGTQFTIGYSPTNEKRDGTYRRIKIELKGVAAGAKVRSRDGYTAPNN
ncbi:MAG: VWA domain-containing protein [Acidobacteriota bacterium]